MIRAIGLLQSLLYQVALMGHFNCMSISIEKLVYKSLKKSAFLRLVIGSSSFMDGTYYALFSISSLLVVPKILNKKMSRKYLNTARIVLGFQFISTKQAGIMTLFTS